MTHRPLDSDASWSINGAIARQGPHHWAQQSTSTGFVPARESSSPSDASVIVAGCESAADADGAGRGWPHLPHTGCIRPARLSSTRFFEPQLGQVMMAIVR